MSANKASQNMDALRRAVQAALPGLRWDEYHSKISPREYGDDLSVRLWGDGTFSAWGETLLRAGITHADEVAELLRAEVQKRADLAERAMGLRPRVELESELAALRESARWIPVGERLPDEGEKIMAFTLDSDVIWAWLERGVFEDEDGRTFRDGYITHWKHEPAPPEPQAVQEVPNV